MGNSIFSRVEEFFSGLGESKDNKSMVDQLRRERPFILEEVAEVMETIDRGLFVPGGTPAYMAYRDRLVLVPMAGVILQPPHMHMIYLELLKDNLQPGMHALVFGSGTGYLTACFAVMVGSQGRAVGIEHVPELVTWSIKNIKKSEAAPLLEAGSLSVHVDDGGIVYPGAPYDAILIGADAPETPEYVLDQLKPGGRLVIPSLQVIDKEEDGSVNISNDIPFFRGFVSWFA